MNQTELARLESALWEAADGLRANGKVQSSDYVQPVLGIIFLRHATNRYETALAAIQAEQAAGKMPQRPLLAADFTKRRALLLPETARFGYIMSLPRGTDLGVALIAAMDAIEKQFESLSGQLPKGYDAIDPGVLEDLLRVFDGPALKSATGDVFGRIYEYFLMKFAMQGAQDNGEFFTPPSIVQTIVNILAPDHGTVFDPACGSGGMFVQSSHFIEEHGEDTAGKVTFYGHEKIPTTIRLAKMNLAVHGLEGDIKDANTFYQDPHNLLGKCDFVMANPPFNVDAIDAEKVRDDPRLPFGLPGVNKGGKVSNGNYLWISYFYSYLNETGRAGFVMSSQASSASHGEAEVRRKLVETGAVDVMLAVRGNFFYTRTVPCELWFFDKGKPADRLDMVLMLDARNVYRKVTRKIYDFSPEQQQNLQAIVALYRDDGNGYDDILHARFKKFAEVAGTLLDLLDPFAKAVGPVALAAHPSWPTDADTVLDDMDGIVGGIRADFSPHINNFLMVTPMLTASEPAWRQLRKSTALLVKTETERLRGEGEAAEIAAGRRAVQKKIDALNLAFQPVDEGLAEMLYLYGHIRWLMDRFPEGEWVDVPGLCKRVTIADIAAADWSLTPGRYVGVAPAEVEEGFDFAAEMRAIHDELAELNAEAVELSERIQKNLAGLLG